MSLSLKFNHFAKSALVVAPAVLAVAGTIYNSGLEAIFMSAVAGACVSYRAFKNRTIPKDLPPKMDESVISSERLDYIARKVGLNNAPDVFVLQNDSPVAHAVFGKIVVTLGLLKAFSNDEVEAIIAHEMAHVYRKDHAWVRYENKAVSYASFDALAWNATLLFDALQDKVTSLDAQNVLLSLSALCFSKGIANTIRTKEDSIKKEFDCDERAVIALGSKAETISAFKKVEKITPDEYFHGSANHPSMVSRIERLEALQL